MPSRRECLIAGASVALAGCITAPPDRTQEPEPIVDQFDCEEADRPEPDIEAGVEHEIEREDGSTDVYTSVGSADYPEPPESLDEAHVETFLREHEAAYLRNNRAETWEEGLIEFSTYFDEIRFLDRWERIEIVVLHVDTDEKMFHPWQGVESMVVGHTPQTVAYALDETGLVRLGRILYEDREDPPSVLEEGDLVACF